ncbi:helix-turn-helix domain-containing protein [Yinghuangia sp. ASG 101]|uniref:PucR family transcriptional regulator n=1 Tax=Yinghuangia sp. ASG 101 TaxID=2896848 RepID=UPI001E35458A|nr:helix-turn-helix domain-containing protein [Yinghuangia sp. ASG 101]UGQ13042.1 helix-turn-helix domain-containing protein [Yinghuangia sp. ASG 101]
MGIGGDSPSAATGRRPPVRSGGGVGGVADAAAGATGATGRDADNAVKRKAGRVAKVAKTGAVGGSGVVSSTQAAGTGTRETVRTLPTRRRPRANTGAEATEIPPPESTQGPPGREADPRRPAVRPGDPPEPGHGTAIARAGGAPEQTVAPPRTGGVAPADEYAGEAELGLSRVLLPAAAQALAVAGRLARAAADAGADAGEIKYRADLVRDLLTGRLADPGWLPPHGLGALLAREVTVVVAQPDPLPGDSAAGLRRHQDALTAAWASALRVADPDAVVAGYPGEIVALITAPYAGGGRATAAAVGRDAAARVRAACARLPRTFTTGISRPACGIEALPGAYEQAHRALEAGRRLQGPGAVTDFDRLGVFRLLAMLPADGELERFAGEVLGPLAAGDDPEAGELRRTLHVLLETNLNVAETSRRLFVHYNTLRYRIGKLERLVGPFTQDSRLRLDLLIALETVHLADTAPPGQRRSVDEPRR